MSNLTEKAEPSKKADLDQIISLMDVYLSEWIHRGTDMWAQVYRFFYASLVVMVLPNISSYLGVTLPPISAKAFPLLGIVMSVVFLYVSLSYAKRLNASGNTYAKLINMLPEELRRDKVTGKLFTLRLSAFIPVTLAAALITVGITMLIA